MNTTADIAVKDPVIIGQAAPAPVSKIAQLRQELAELEAKERADRDKQRDAYEALKEDTVNDLVGKAVTLNAALSDFKAQAFSDSQAIYQALQDYSERYSDGKGNFSIENKAKTCRLTYKKQGKPSFDERSEQAEKHIIDFVEKKFNDDKDTRDLIMSLMERKNGHLDIDLIQKLYAMEDRFDDANWKKGIKLLKESYSYNHSKDYINFFLKDDKGAWQPVVLQFSTV